MITRKRVAAALFLAPATVLLLATAVTMLVTYPFLLILDLLSLAVAKLDELFDRLGGV